MLCEIDYAATGAMVGGIATALYAVFTLLLWINSKKILVQTQKLHEADSRPWIKVKDFQIRRRGGAIPFNKAVDKVVKREVDETHLTAESLNRVLREEWIAEIDIANIGKSPARVSVVHVSWIEQKEPLEKKCSADNFQTVVMPGESVHQSFVLLAATSGTKPVTKLPGYYAYSVEVLYNMGTLEPGRTIAHFDTIIPPDGIELEIVPAGIEYE